MKWTTVYLFTVAFVAVARADAPANLVIHEWGTFSSLQNSRGEAIGGINIDDEPVPAFVHALDASLVQRQPSETERKLRQSFKGVFDIGPHPDITMRLETPVVYFYDRRPSDKPLPPLGVDLSVTFNGGYLTQFYPNASGPVPVVTRDLAAASYVPLTQETTHTLSWDGLKIGQAGEGPKTESRVWTAPREVKAANVVAANGESEKFLFYRGVGNMKGPLKVVESDLSREAGVRYAEIKGQVIGQQLDIHTTIAHLWLVEIAADGKIAMQTLPAVNLVDSMTKGLPLTRLTFAEADFAVDNLKKLRDSMREGLVAEGLYADEADAMLNTWEASYFKSPGLRLFYLVPREWTDQKLPLKVSVPADITRVMVGRIELVSPEQSALLKTITDARDLPRLGRFAGALLNDENARNPSPRLANLINQAGLQPAKVAR